MIFALSLLYGAFADIKPTTRNNGINEENPAKMPNDDDGRVFEAKNTKDIIHDNDIFRCDADSTMSTCNMGNPNPKQYSDFHMAPSPNNAVVLYQPEVNTPLKRFKIPTRTFHFAGRTLTIQQKWDDHGVAAVVWDSAIVLCEFLEREKHLVKNKNIIELGSGTGLVGLVAAYLGGHVTVTERESVLDYLRSVVKANVEQDDQETRIKVSELDWTANDLRDSFPLEYDLILGADIIYIEKTFPDLERTLLYLSNRPNCTILLSCKIRYEKDSKFLEKLNDYFTVKRLLYEPGRDISIFRIKDRKSVV